MFQSYRNRSIGYVCLILPLVFNFTQPTYAHDTDHHAVTGVILEEVEYLRDVLEEFLAERQVVEEIMRGDCLISRTSFGGNGGRPFSPIAPLYVSMRTGGWIDAIILNGDQHGGNGGSKRGILQFLPNEYINRAVIGAGTHVDRLEFYTNYGRSISGGEGGLGGRLTSLDNIRMLRIGGRSDVYLDRIEVIYCANYLP